MPKVEWLPMKCIRCYSNDCVHAQMDMMNMAAQQQGGLSQMQYLGYLQQQSARIMNEEMIKAYSAPKKSKKLLLLRK